MPKPFPFGLAFKSPPTTRQLSKLFAPEAVPLYNRHMQKFEALFHKYMQDLCMQNPDPSHDISHVERVVHTAKQLAAKENAKLEVVIPAAYLHDCVYISKTDPRRKQASRISAEKAMELLREWSYPEVHHREIFHAIESHSFSAGVEPKTLEAKIVQDADRLDAIGAIGILRCFAFSGLSGRAFYNSEDPFCDKRTPDDSKNTLDHFYIKLFKLKELLHTESAKLEGIKRTETMHAFLNTLKNEIV